MIHLKYKCEVNFMKLPLILIDMCLGCELCELLVAASADSFWCGLLHWKCGQAMHLALPPSHCKTVLSSIPIHNNPVGLILETWLANHGDRHVRSIAQGNDSSGNFLTSREEWGGALSCWKYIRPRLSKGISSKIRGNSSCRNLRHASAVRRPCKMKGPISWSSRTAHHTLTIKCSWKLLSTVVWRFSSAHTWELCVLLALSRLNCASSVNRM